MDDTTHFDIHLRAMEPEDLDILYKIENDTNLWNVGVTNVPYSRYILHNYIADTVNDIYADGQLRMMVADNEDNVVGIIDLVNFEPRHQRAEISVVIMSRYRHRGYGAQALLKIIGYARDVLHLHQVYALVDSENTECYRLLKSIGFRHTGTFPEWLCKNGGYHDALLMQYFI